MTVRSPIAGFRSGASRPGLGAAVAIVLVGLGGCAGSATDGLKVDLASHVLGSYVHLVSVPHNAIEHALAYCTDKTLAAETACVRQGIADAQLDPPALVAMIPGCHPYAVCHYDYVTKERLGYVQFSAEEFDVRWRVDFDFTKPLATLASLPITVSQL